jgi:hypothetical protein
MWRYEERKRGFGRSLRGRNGRKCGKEWNGIVGRERKCVLRGTNEGGLKGTNGIVLRERNGRVGSGTNESVLKGRERKCVEGKEGGGKK